MTVEKSSFSLALVTGASSGIGAAISRLLAKKGIPLIITGRNLERLGALAAELAASVPVEIVAADLAIASEREKLIDMIKERTPDLVINNAGFGLYGKAVDGNTTEQLQVVDVDVCAVLQLTLEAAKAMKEKNKSGVILNVSSTAGFYVFPYAAVYAASKAFVNNISEALDIEMQRDGIRVLAACPGMVATNFAKRAGGKEEIISGGIVMTPEYAAEEIWGQIIRRQPIYIFSRFYRWVTRLVAPLFPRRWVSKIIKNNIKSRNTK